MKMSLRNFALAGALALAGVAVAQDAPTVTKNYFWHDAGTTYTINEFRGGTGWDGYCINPDKTNKKILYFNADGLAKTVDLPEGAAMSCAITHDDAGNIVFHSSWAGAGCTNGAGNWYIYTPSNGEFKTFKVTIPTEEDAVAAGRMDFVGRIVGDVLSEEGGLMILCTQNSTKPAIVKIAEGEQVDLDFSDYPIPDTAYEGFDTTTLGQFFYDFEQIVDMGDDWASGIALRKRGNLLPVWLQDGAWVKMPAATGATGRSSEGFDVFTLNDEVYEVVPVGAVNYTSRFAIVNADTNETIYISPEEDEVSVAAGQGFGSITANKVSDSKVEIYISGITKGNVAYAGMYTVEIPAGEVAPLYIVGDATTAGWEPGTPAEMTYDAESKLYTYATTGGSFKISTTKGTWDEFNAGVIGAAEDNQTYNLKVDEPVAIMQGKIGTFAATTGGDYVIKVDLANNLITLTGTAPVLPDAPENVYVRGALSGWGIQDAYKMSLSEERGMAGEYVYTIDLVNPTGEFKINDGTNDNWNAGKINHGIRYPENNPITTGEGDESKTYDSWYNAGNFAFANDLGEVTLKFYWNPDNNQPSYLLLAKTTGVANIAADAAAPAVYYNLNGVEVNGKLASGLYIKVANGKATKVLVK